MSSLLLRRKCIAKFRATEEVLYDIYIYIETNVAFGGICFCACEIKIVLSFLFDPVVQMLVDAPVPYYAIF